VSDIERKSSPDDWRQKLAAALTASIASGQIEGPPATEGATPYSGKRTGSCVLLDTTGSMWAVDGPNGIMCVRAGRPDEHKASGDRRIDRLRAAVRDFPKDIRKFDYNDDIFELADGQECREPRGGNNEEKAFEHLKSQGFKHCIIITDGGADRPGQALKVARQTGMRFDVIYIGPPPAPDFLKQLTELSGGSLDKVTFDSGQSQKLLAQKVKALLGPGGEEKTRKGKGKGEGTRGPICL